MSKRGLEALDAERAEALALAELLTEQEWAAQSDCAGWRVQDVFAHLACTFRSVVDPASLPAPIPDDLEASQELGVEQRRGWSAEEVVEEYRTLSTQGLGLLAGLQEPPLAETEITISNAGRYPMHLVANALAFDHYCHLRHDILGPGGPIDRTAPPHDELRLSATLEWLLAGLTQMSGAALQAALDRPVMLRLTGPGGSVQTLTPAPGGPELVGDASLEASATVTTPASELVIWGTHRRPWRDRDVVIEGDSAYAATVLDAIHLF